MRFSLVEWIYMANIVFIISCIYLSLVGLFFILFFLLFQVYVLCILFAWDFLIPYRHHFFIRFQDNVNIMSNRNRAKLSCLLSNQFDGFHTSNELKIKIESSMKMIVPWRKNRICINWKSKRKNKNSLSNIPLV